MSNWFFGVIADCAYCIARFQEWRGRKLIARGERTVSSAEYWQDVDEWAGGETPWHEIYLRRARERNRSVPFATALVEGPHP